MVELPATPPVTAVCVYRVSDLTSERHSRHSHRRIGVDCIARCIIICFYLIDRTVAAAAGFESATNYIRSRIICDLRSLGRSVGCRLPR